MAVVSTAILLSCATTGPGGKKSLIFISTGQETSLGQQFDQQVRSENKVLADSVWQSYLNDIGQSIVKVSDRKDIEYHFAVIESEMVNAFATPGGYIYIYTGLLRHMENEAQLAAVTAHEVSHVVARHSVQRLQTAVGIGVLQEIAFGGKSGATQQAVNLGIGMAMQGFSRGDELESDRYGVHYMTLAGYNPKGAEEMFGILKSLGPEKQNVFEKLSASHPDADARIEQVKTLIAVNYASAANRPMNAERYQKLKARLPQPQPEEKP